MPRKTTVKEFPFLEGQHQEIDAKVLPDGYLSACKNVRLRKDGRFGVRADFDAIGNDTRGSNDLVPRDLIGFGDALCALGASQGITSDEALWDIHDYTGTTPAEWAPSSGGSAVGRDQLRLSPVTNIRTLAAQSLSAGASVAEIDCAAAGGVVCVAYAVAAGATSNYLFFRASTGSKLLETTLNGSRPRVVTVGTAFFFLAFDAAAGLALSKYDPVTDAAPTVLTAPVAAALNCYDVAPTLAGTGFWVTYNTTGPTTIIKRFTAAGAVNTTFSGPAVTYSHVTIVETTNRVHLVTVTGAGLVQLRSYTVIGALSTGPSASSITATGQATVLDSTYAGTEQVTIYGNIASGIVQNETFAATTHVSGGAATAAIGTLGAKPVMGGTPNYHGILGAVVNDGVFFSSYLKATQPSQSSQPAVVGALINKFSGAATATNHVPKIGKDTSTGKFYWPTLFVDDQSVSYPRVTELDFLSSARRQTAQIADLLYVGGGAVGAYDTRLLCQSGVFLKPRIISATASNGAGSLPSSVSLLTSYVSEGRDYLGNLVEGDIANPSTTVMGAADDTITLSIGSDIGLPTEQRVYVGYRSISGISQLRRAETTTNSSLVFLASDTTARTHGVIYPQAGRAALGAILPHEAPLPADYIWKFGSRLLAANANGAQVSKEIFPGRQVEWSGAVGFTVPSIPERITGCAALDQRGFLFTSERVYQFSGDGPNDAGEGRYSEPLPIPGSTGLLTWQSLVETPLGLFFQGSNGQLWLLPRDGSPPSWIGQAVRDVLVSFPTVTAAVLLVKEQLVSFTCNNSGGTDARVVSYDLRAKTWIVDEFTSSTPITAACSYQGRLAYLSSGIVYTEKTSLTPAAFIEHSVTTGTVKPYDWGKICGVELLGEYRGDCNLRCRISYDDGKTYTNLATHQLRSTEFAVGDTVERTWAPLRRKCDSFKLDFQALTPGSASEGLVFNAFRIEYMPERGAARRPGSQRG